MLLSPANQITTRVFHLTGASKAEVKPTMVRWSLAERRLSITDAVCQSRDAVLCSGVSIPAAFDAGPKKAPGKKAGKGKAAKEDKDSDDDKPTGGRKAKTLDLLAALRFVCCMVLASTRMASLL